MFAGLYKDPLLVHAYIHTEPHTCTYEHHSLSEYNNMVLYLDVTLLSVVVSTTAGKNYILLATLSQCT